MTAIQGDEAGAPSAKSAPSRFRILMRTNPEYVLAPLLFVILVVAWEFGVVWLETPRYILPPPSDIIWALWGGLSESLTSRAGYWMHAGVTVTEVLLGFVIGSSIGLLLGTIISQFRILEATLRLYLVAIQSLPKIALAPIIVLWFGFGLTSKVVIICLLTFFPLLVTSMAGFRAVEPERLELMKAIGANSWQIFWKARLPSALPYIFAGLEMAAVFSVVGAIVGEFVGAQRGLGTLILSMNAQMDTAGTFSIFIILSFIGLLLHGGLRFAARRILFWTNNETQSVSS